MDFDAFIGHCGRSLFAEEYRGDFNSAQNDLASYQVEDLNDPETHATYLRCNIVFSTLRGRLSSAYGSLNDLRSLLERLPAYWGLRYTNYKALVDYNRRYPPCIRFHHEPNIPIEFPVVADIDGHAKIVNELMQNVRTYAGSGQPRDQGFCILQQGIIYFPMHLRSLATKFHPLLRLNPESEPMLTPDIILAQNANPILNMKNKAVAMNAGPIVHYFDRLIAELHLAFASSSSLSNLRDLYRAYEREGDLAGMGNCKLMEGDNSISPSFTSPLALNMVLFDATTGTGDDDKWDAIEAKFNFQPSTTAEESYNEALALFKRAGCQRGEAAVFLRQSCYMHMIASAIERHRDRKAVLEKASSKLRSALDLFGLDEGNSQIAKTHLILVDISMGQTSDVVRQAAEIGRWGIDARNENISHSAGLLMTRYARREWQTYSRLDTARIAYECAYACFHALNSVVPTARTLLARARMHADMHNFTAARVLCRDSVEMFEDVLRWYETKIASLPQTNFGSVARQTYITQKASMIWSFGEKITQIYLHIEALEELQNWYSQFMKLRDSDESFLEMISAFDKCDAKGESGSWARVVSDHTVWIKFCIAKIRFRRSLDDGDIELGQKILHEFINEALNFDESNVRDGLRILACELLGDATKAHQILDSMPDSTLFQDLFDRFAHGEGLHNFFPTAADNILSRCVIAEDWTRGQRMITLLEQIDPKYCTQPSHNNWVDYSFRLESLSLIALYSGQFELAFRRLLQCRKLIELRRSQTSDIDAKIGMSLANRVLEVFVSLARICIACSEAGLPNIQSVYDHGHPNGISWYEHALLYIEEGRARVVLETLQAIDQSHVEESRRRDFSDLNYKRRAIITLRSLPFRTASQGAELQRLEEEVANLRLEHAPTSHTAELLSEENMKIQPRDLLQSIPDEALLLEISFYARGCIGLAITKAGIQQHFTSSVRFTDMLRLSMKYMQVMRSMTGYKSVEEDERKRQLRTLSQEISSILLSPFGHLIRSTRHIIFSVSHPLTAFPFSALMFDDKPLIQTVAVSQVPSLTVLFHLSKYNDPTRPTASVFTKAPTSPELSSEARGSSTNDEANLHMANIEAVNIAYMFSTWPIEASTLTRKRFREYLQGKYHYSPPTVDRAFQKSTSSSILHIGTHGDLDTRNPLLSSISIGEDFRVLDMSAVQKSEARLLVFAACLSGLGKPFGNEVAGFSHVVLGTGCKAYLGTLWKVSDFGSMCLMTMFYRNLRRHHENGRSQTSLSLAEALRAAQLELLSWNARKARRFLDDLINSLTSIAVANDSISASSLSDLQEERAFIMSIPETQFLLRTRKMILSQLDFESPFFWASFVLMGCGDYRFDNSGDDK